MSFEILKCLTFLNRDVVMSLTLVLSIFSRQRFNIGILNILTPKYISFFFTTCSQKNNHILEMLDATKITGKIAYKS